MADVLWEPDDDAWRTTRLGEFAARCAERTGRRFGSYDELWEWSTDDGLEACWATVWEYFDVLGTPFEQVLDRRVMPGARWFVGAELNYAEQALRHAAGRAHDAAIIGISQTRDRQEVSWGQLVDQVARVRTWLKSAGVEPGDRVAAYLPNVPETIVAFLATASLGAIWTSCAPEFGVRAVLDRFAQVGPKVLFAVDGYRYGSKDVSRVDELAAIRDGLPSVAHTVMLPYLHPAPDGSITWHDVLATEPDPLAFERVAPDHPLYVLYSSGTTGMPKPIVHGHGGITLEHLKVIGLHCDLGSDDRLFWFTTTGWMMWNFLASALLVGATAVTFDGDPNGDGPETLWRLAATERATAFGVGSPFLAAASRGDLDPGAEFDLSAIRLVGATGAPLPASAFDWVYRHVSPNVLLSPISGGTDVCSAFVGGSPLTPVWRGEIPCSYLGCAVAAFDEAGEPVIGTQGELVLVEPMPSMPVGFWGDDDGSRYRASYFEQYPGVWRHGDWITITERGSCVISGRSDATLNRGGVRVGTAEIYRVAEAIDGVDDSLVVHLEAPDADDPGTLVLFVALDDGLDLDDERVRRIRSEIRAGCSPRHVPDEVHRISSVPTTLSGKKLELPVKRILTGSSPDQVASRGALKNPASLDEIADLAARRSAT